MAASTNSQLVAVSGSRLSACSSRRDSDWDRDRDWDSPILHFSGSQLLSFLAFQLLGYQIRQAGQRDVSNLCATTALHLINN